MMICKGEYKVIVEPREENLGLAIKYAIITNFLFALSTLSIKYFMEEQSSHQTFEFAIYQQFGIALTSYACIKYLGNHLKEYIKEDHIDMWMIIRVILLLLGPILVVVALSNIKPSWLTVIVSMSPIFVNLLSSVILKQRFLISYIFYCLAAFAGVLIMINGSAENSNPTLDKDHNKNIMIGLSVSTIFTFSIAILDISMIKLTEKFDAFSLNFYCSIYSATLGLIILAMNHGPLSIFKSTKFSLVLFGLGNGFIMGLSLFYLNLAFQLADASKTTYFSYIQVPLTAVLSYFLFGDLLNFVELLGISIIMSSIAYATIWGKSQG